MTECTLPLAAAASAIIAKIVALVAPQLERIQNRLEQFRQQPVTPTAFFELETHLQADLREVGRRLLEQLLSQLEPATAKEAEPRLSFQGEAYRRPFKQPKTLYSSFGPLAYARLRYEACERGEPSVFPLDFQLGLEAHLATPALAEHVGRLAVQHEQRQVLAILRCEHEVCWSADTLRKVTAALHDGMASFREPAQIAKLLQWLQQASLSRGRYRPVLAVGRDGIMVPMRHQGYKEASTGTLSIHDRRGQRLGTIYLGCMPEPGQATLTRQLQSLLRRVLEQWHAQGGACPRLVYLTDGGYHPRDFYRRVLRHMRDPWSNDPKQKLCWQWILDYWHVCGYINKLAEALFGNHAQAYAWFHQMRHWLRDRTHGIAHVLRSATQHEQRRRLSQANQEAFDEAYLFLRKNSRWMQYAAYRRHGLPIGSGVTEAACKTVFTQRLKRSGMSWHKETGQIIVTLRILYLSGIWQEVYAQKLSGQVLPQGGSPYASAGRHYAKAA